MAAVRYSFIIEQGVTVDFEVVYNAICTANKVLPDPALPTIKLKGCFNISVFAFFCSSDKLNENLIDPLGGVFDILVLGIIYFN